MRRTHAVFSFDRDPPPRPRPPTCTWRIALAAAGALALTFVVSVLVALQTDGVRTYVMRAIGFDNSEPHAPMQTRYTSVDGFFPFRFSIHGFCLVTATGDTICAPRADVSFAPSGLFVGEVLVSSIDVPELRVRVRAEPARRVDELPPWIASALAVHIATVKVHAVYLGDEAAPRVRARLSALAGARLAVTVDADTLGASAVAPRASVSIRVAGDQRTQLLHANILIAAALDDDACNATVRVTADTSWSHYLWLIINPAVPAPVSALDAHLIDLALDSINVAAACPEWVPTAARAHAHIDARRTIHLVSAEMARDNVWTAAAAGSRGAFSPLKAMLRATYALTNASARLDYADGAGVLDASATLQTGEAGRALVVGNLDVSTLPVALRTVFEYAPRAASSNAGLGRLRVSDISVIVSDMRILGGTMDVAVDEVSGAIGGVTGDLMGTSDAFGRVLDAHVRLEHNRTHQSMRATVGTARLAIGALLLETVEATLDAAAALDRLLAVDALTGQVGVRVARLVHVQSGVEASALVVASRIGDAGANAFSIAARGDLVDGAARGTWTRGLDGSVALALEPSPVLLRRTHAAWLEGRVSLERRVVRAEASATARDAAMPAAGCPGCFATDARRLITASLEWPLDDGAPFRADAEFSGDVGALAALVRSSAGGVQAGGALGGNMHVSGVRARRIDTWHGTVTLGSGRVGASPLGPLRDIDATLHCVPGDRHWLVRSSALAGDGSLTASGRVHPELSYASGRSLPALAAEIPFTLDVALRRAAGLAAAHFSVNASVTLDLG